MTRTDLLRRGVLGTAAAAQTLVPTLGPRLTGRDEGTDRYDTDITPPDYAFAVWGPIFAVTLADAVRQAAGKPGGAAVMWPLAGAYVLNTAWSATAQARRFRATPPILAAEVACAATAYRRLQKEPSASALTAGATGLLLGWTALAATVNAIAARRRPTSPSVAAGSAAAVAAAVCATVLSSRRGYVPLAAATAWGLGTTALTSHRPAVVRAVAGLGTAGVCAAAARRFSG